MEDPQRNVKLNGSAQSPSIAWKRWLSIPEAAEYYGLHPKSLYELTKQRLIPFTRIPSLRGGRGMIRIDRRRLDELMEQDEIVLEVRR